MCVEPTNRATTTTETPRFKASRRTRRRRSRPPTPAGLPSPLSRPTTAPQLSPSSASAQQLLCCGERAQNRGSRPNKKTLPQQESGSTGPTRAGLLGRPVNLRDSAPFWSVCFSRLYKYSVWLVFWFVLVPYGFWKVLIAASKCVTWTVVSPWGTHGKLPSNYETIAIGFGVPFLDVVQDSMIEIPAMRAHYMLC
jgi:hypothetical protein